MNFILLTLLLVAPFQSADKFSATVEKSRAVFSMPVEARDRWSWARPETRPNAREYQMDVVVKNDGKEYSFGFYLWKGSVLDPGSGSLKDLISVGQKSVFVRNQAGLMSIVREAEVKVEVKDNRLEITIQDSEDLKRLFSSHPAEVTFRIKNLDAPEISQTIPIVYH